MLLCCEDDQKGVEEARDGIGLAQPMIGEQLCNEEEEKQEKSNGIAPFCCLKKIRGKSWVAP
jgi:hypothetical protein